jgi:hypothetical protein
VDTLGYCETIDLGTALAVAGTHVYVAGAYEDEALGGTVAAMQVIDVSDPRTPIPVGLLPIDVDSTWIGDIEADGQHAYLTLNTVTGGRVYVIDVSDHTHLTTKGYAQLGSQHVLQGCSVDLPWVYTTYYSQQDGAIGGLCVIDVRDPEDPRLVAECDIGENVMAMCVSDHYAYLVSRSYNDDVDGFSCRLHVVDIRDPVSPFLVSTRRISAYNDGPNITWANGLLLLGFQGWTCGGGVVVVDVGDPIHPYERGTYLTPCVRPIGMTGGYAYLSSCGPDQILDLRNPDRPVCVGETDLGGLASVGQASGQYVYTLVSNTLVCVVSITELPAITRQFIQNGKLNLQWNEPARGMTLQRSTSLENPDWQDMQGSQTMTSVELQLWGGPEYFRLAFDAPENMVWIEPGTFMMGSPEDRAGSERE